MKDVRVVVTGGSGFVGAALVKSLSATNQVLSLDFPYDAAELAYPDVDIVMHMACLRMASCEQSEYLAYRSNVLTVARQVQRNPDALHILASTSSLYDGGFLRHEDSTIRPSTVYARTKLAAEQLVASTKNYRILRFGNVYGPGHYPNHKSPDVISTFVYKALVNEPLLLHNSGDDIRDFVYIDDIVSGVCKSVNGINAIYNLGTGQPTKIHELVGKISELIPYTRWRETSERRPIDTVRVKTLSSVKAQQHFDWKAGWSLRSGLKQTVEWQRKHCLAK